MTAGRARAVALLPVRWSGLALAAGLALTGHGVEAAVAMLVALAQVVGWRSRLPLAWEVATSAACMVAAISSFLLLYERIPWWDVPVHTVLNGLLAVLVARVVRSREVSAAEVVVTGAVLAVVWELMELAGHHWVDPAVHVAPADTALDLIVALGGSAVAALLWRRRRSAHQQHRDERHEQGRGSETPDPARHRAALRGHDRRVDGDDRGEEQDPGEQEQQEGGGAHAATAERCIDDDNCGPSSTVP